jgi:hypothetical protein
VKSENGVARTKVAANTARTEPASREAARCENGWKRCCISIMIYHEEYVRMVGLLIDRLKQEFPIPYHTLLMGNRQLLAHALPHRLQ